jgi:hypothetical protein
MWKSKMYNKMLSTRIIIHTIWWIIIMNQWDGFIILIIKMKTQNHLWLLFWNICKRGWLIILNNVLHNVIEKNLEHFYQEQI